MSHTQSNEIAFNIMDPDHVRSLCLFIRQLNEAGVPYWLHHDDHLMITTLEIGKGF